MGASSAYSAGRATIHPPHDFVCVAVETFEDDFEQVRPISCAVVRPQYLFESREPNPGAATFIGKREPPTADAIFSTIKDGPADAARSGDDNSSIAALVSADARRSRVRCDHRAAERVAGLPGGSKFLRLAGSGQG